MYLLSLISLFLFVGFVYAEEPEVSREYWDNGKLKKETYYQNGKEEGVVTVWYKNGQKQTKGHYKQGRLNGLLSSWYQNGKKMSETSFINDKEV